MSTLAEAPRRLTLDCAPLAEPVWVDRDMWEKSAGEIVEGREIDGFSFANCAEKGLRTSFR